MIILSVILHIEQMKSIINVKYKNGGMTYVNA